MINLDPKDVLGSTGMLVSQCKQIWKDCQVMSSPIDDSSSIQNIVLCGMGGSAYGGYVVNALYKEGLKVPLISNNDYTLPGFVNSDTLVILSSYSGSTEEVLNCANLALEKGAKVSAISGGGKLGTFLSDNGFAGLIFDPKFNPSGQPRLGTGYMVLGLLGLLNKNGLINITDEEVDKAIVELEQSQENIKKEAKALSEKILGSIPLIIAAEHLSGNIHILRNQFNETAKSFSAFSFLPELNHHMMEGLKNPPDKKLMALFINSDLYSDKLKQRFKLTEDVVSKNNIESAKYQVSGSSKLSQMLNLLSFGGYVTVYLAFLYNQDPSVIPWVDYFKDQLVKSP